MRALLIACAAVTLLGVPANAAFKGCYERVYDKRYLRKNPKQEIVKIRIQLGMGGKADDPPEFLDRVDAVSRKGGRYRGGYIECQPKGDELSCAIEADGGTFTLTDRGGDSLRITNDSFMRFGEEDRAITVQGRGQNKEFRLFRINEGICP